MAAEAMAPSHLALLRVEAVRSLQNPLWGSQLGVLNLAGEITIFQLEAGRRWGNLARQYQKALGAKGIRPVSLELVGATHDFDPDSREGVELAETEQRICECFEDALKALYDSGRAAVFSVRQLCEEDRPLSWQQKRDLIRGLDALSTHWGLTGAKRNVRNSS